MSTHLTSVSLNDSVQQSELAELADKLNTIAARLSGFAPILVRITDSGNIGVDEGNSLEVIGGMSEYINDELCSIAGRLCELSVEGGVA